MAKQHYDFDLIVLGSGCGGSVAALIAAGAGKRVAMVEPAELGGECPNWGCVPSKALLHAAGIYDAAKHAQQFGIRSGTLTYNYPSIKAWKDLAVRRTGATEGKRLYEAEGIKVYEGKAYFLNQHEVMVSRRNISAEHFLVATGTHSFIPSIDGLQEAGYLTFKEAANITRPPKSLFIIGAGTVGCEFAELFAIFGTRVYLSDITPRILAQEDEEVSELVRQIFEQERGMHVLTNTKVQRVAKEGLAKRIYYQQGAIERSVKVDEILVAAGKLANVNINLENAGIEYTPRGINVNEYMQTTTKHIYAAGDVVGPYYLAHTAIYQSRVAANNILNRQKISTDYRAVPRVIFLHPEVASVGLSEDECIRRDLRIKKAIAPITIIGRANTSNVDQGFVKVITDTRGALLGASIISPCAGEIIHELTLAIRMRLNAQHIANTIHAFPTWSEAVRIACSKVAKM